MRSGFPYCLTRASSGAPAPNLFRDMPEEIPLLPSEARMESEARGARPPEAVGKHHAVLGLFTFLWGGNFVLAEVALFEMTPISFSVARFAVGGLGMLGLVYLQRRTGLRGTASLPLFPALKRDEWPLLLLVSLLGATLAPWLGIEGLNLTYAGRAAFWLSLAPVVSAGFGYFMRTEQIALSGRIGLGVAALGALGLALDGFSSGQGYWLGDLLLFAAMLLTVAELHLIKPLALRHGAAPIVTARTMLGGSVYLLIAAPSLAQQHWLSLAGWTWVAILAGGLVGVGIGQWIKVRALRAIGPTQVVIYGNLVPLATLIIGWATLGTRSTHLEVIAGLMIVAGAVCLQIGSVSGRDAVNVAG